MLKYVKSILVRVSFDAILFEKELRKAINLLVQEEIVLLKDWCYQEFKQQYEPVLQRCFT
ncbi:MAG: hypothetical protein O9262_15620 [Cyclobacteriaceae bacterium]|nr:hypothetical protein [Cyclobacteriaceae bacterium]NBP67429.1 hypothetical protein [Cytophagia bacterium]NBW37189.1 hypothetical protein [Cytophagia bacterium]